ncbi:hypothetical protein JCM24511_10058 [Saitozyma sp. JCM 24511]|nr:hypothetical protein JCM24511_10058 [Saitozyma sp. JCM 24511]
MTIPARSSFDGVRFGVATASLGMSPTHTLEDKFKALQAAGFNYTELGFEGFLNWVKQQVPDLPASTCPDGWGEGGEPDPSDDQIWNVLYSKAEDVKALAKSYGLTVLMLQPLNQFDGWPEGSPRANWVRRKAERWLPLCAKLGVEMLQVGSNDFRDATGSDDSTALDLRWLAELGARQQPPVKIAYEAWCFSWRVASWEHAWELVKKGDHPNLGLCLDVAHFPLAPGYGWDPLTGLGWTDDDVKGIVSRLRAVPADKIFYVELSDVLTPVIPLGQGSAFDDWRIQANSPRGDSFVWAVCGRPVPLVGKHAGKAVKGKHDLGGARVTETLKAILDTGFRGPMMFEMFEAIRMAEEDANIPGDYAQACAESQRKLVEALS